MFSNSFLLGIFAIIITEGILTLSKDVDINTLFTTLLEHPLREFFN